MDYHPLHSWDVSAAEARQIQLELRERLVLHPPAGFAPRTFAGADVSLAGQHAPRGFAAIVVLDAQTLAPLEQAHAAAEIPFPYVPGLLSFRELPPLALAWQRLQMRPDVLIFDGHGIAHPRRFGIACHGGLLFGVPSIGCGKSILVGTHGRLGNQRGATAPLTVRGEVVGMAVRTRTGVHPVYVSPGHLMDLPTAVELVLRATGRFREPETTRHAHHLVTMLRIEGQQRAGHQ
jgi:deoxyribonuclease V